MSTHKPASFGIVGAGGFSAAFAELYLRHPLVSSVAVADLDISRARSFATKVPCQAGVFDSLESLCRSDVDAVALFTPRHLHTRHALEALSAGKHVYSAVPASFSLEELEALVAKVKETGLIYMTGETSTYYPSVLFCREKFRAGEFGDFVYGEAQYVHDMETWGPHFELSFGDRWREQAGMPPFFYGTHSVSMPLSVTGARATHVSALGFRDRQEDGVYGTGKNNWNNPHSNEFALMRTSDGGVVRVTEARRLGLFNHGREVCMNMFYGTNACYEETSLHACYARREGRSVTDVSSRVACTYHLFPDESGIYSTGEVEETITEKDGYLGVSEVHPVHRLPRAFRGLHTGHNGTHQFLVDDFVKAVVCAAHPINHVWAAARYCAPGLVAHDSALREGEMLAIPDFGDPAAGVPLLEKMPEFNKPAEELLST